MEILDRSKLDRKLSELGMDDETEISLQENEL
jgi:Fe2+ transport system protein FeoA